MNVHPVTDEALGNTSYLSFARSGLAVDSIGVLVGLYPAVWSAGPWNVVGLN